MEQTEFKEIIQGPRVTLKRNSCSMEHADLIFSMIDKNRLHLLPWLQWVYDTISPEDVMEWLEDDNLNWNNGEEANYSIYLKDKYIGNIGITNIDYNADSANLGYWIYEEYTNRGYASEAIKLLEKEFFDRGLNRMEIRCDEDNLVSSGLAEKLGYSLEGILRQNRWFREGDGEYRNTMVYSKLYYEWKYNNE